MEPKEKEAFRKEILKEVVKDGNVREIIIREGDALEPTPKIKLVDVNFNGTIDAPAEFYKKRKTQFKTDRANIQYSKNPDKLYIELSTNENKERPCYTVRGILELSDEVKLFGIAYKANQKPTSYAVHELAKLIRFNKKLLTAAESKALIEGLTKFKIKVSQEADKIKTSGGNITENFSQTVKHECPMSFTVTAPIYKGKKEKKFNVEIYFDVKSANDITMWLESPDLATAIQTDGEAYISEELAKMNDIVQIEN